MNDQREPERGASLVGIVVVLVILGGLAALAVAALPKDPTGTSALSDQPAAVAGAPSTRPRSLADTTSTASCGISARTIQTAAGAKHAADGAYPASVTELVPAYLSEEPALRGYAFTMQMVGGKPTGNVLVNDLPPDQGCAAAPRPGP